ncbi:hypothetical protein BDV96DRAFT_562749, partial [Lophiotrema nucula]
MISYLLISLSHVLSSLHLALHSHRTCLPTDAHNEAVPHPHFARAHFETRQTKTFHSPDSRTTRLQHSLTRPRTQCLNQEAGRFKLKRRRRRSPAQSQRS